MRLTARRTDTLGGSSSGKAGDIGCRNTGWFHQVFDGATIGVSSRYSRFFLYT